MPETSVALDAVCFDMDGLTVETESLWFIAETRVMAELDAPWTPEDQAHCLGGPLTRVGQYMVDRAGRGDAREAVQGLIDHMEHLIRTSTVVWQPGAVELLLALREDGIPRALVSASPIRLVSMVLERLREHVGFDVFDTAVAAEDTARTKPHPDPYLEGCRRLDARPENTVVLEDSANGAAAGLAAGCLVLGVPHIAPIPPAPRLQTVTSLEQVTPEFLRALVLQ